MWKSKGCAQGVRERAHGRIAIAAIVAVALAAFAPSSLAEPSREPFQAQTSAVTLPEADPVARALRQFVDDAKWRPGRFNLDWNGLRSLYSGRGFRPVWTTPSDEKQAREVLAHVEREGLSPGDYAMEAILRPESDEPAKLAKYDLLLTDALLHYASDVRLGRVPAGAGDIDVDLPAQHYNAVEDLETALSGGAFAGYLAALPPMENEYRALRRLLARYRAIAARGGWLDIPEGEPIGLAARNAQSFRERDRLLIEDEAFSAEPARTDGLRDAIARFQQHHGLGADRHVGRETIAALNVPVEARIGQIEANMERWRWMPRTLELRYVAVNTAAAMLEVYDLGGVTLSSRVIVGSPKTPTPIVRAEATALTVNPSWHVPAKIARKEILPKAGRDSGYLDAHHMVMDEASHSLSQLPGPGNSLGVLKLEMSDRFDVYLHDTDAHEAFDRPLRDRSHGCVRVEQILPLASIALTGNVDDAISDLTDAIALGETERMSLPARLPVYILYWTTTVNDDGSAQFWPDIYARDEHLRDALANRVAEQRLSML
jgi:murein L,D-transpeptidase YcbB/YkuD